MNAAIIAWDGILKTLAVKNIAKVCNQFNINLETVPMPSSCDSNTLWEMIQNHKNVIAWACPSEAEEFQKINRNILFMDNSALDPGKFLYLDDNGLGKNSNIVLNKLNQIDYPDNIKQEILTYLSFQWPSSHSVDKNGYILVALQNRLLEDKALLLKCERFLPLKSKVVLRAMENALMHQTLDLCKEFCQKHKNWVIEETLDSTKSLQKAKALVTNYNNLLYQALFMRIPVAVCMPGLHTGSSSVLDCSRSPMKLSYIFDYYYNEKDAHNLICSIYVNSISKNISKKDILRNTNFANWLKRIKVN